MWWAFCEDASEKKRTLAARALLDPRYRLQFAVSVLHRHSGELIETRTGSQGGSGGEKEIIASYILTASLSYALCPDGASQPLFGTIILDEAFSKSSQAVAGRIISALKEFGLHSLFITPNKEMRLLRDHTRSALLVHRNDLGATLTALGWGGNWKARPESDCGPPMKSPEEIAARLARQWKNPDIREWRLLHRRSDGHEPQTGPWPLILPIGKLTAVELEGR